MTEISYSESVLVAADIQRAFDFRLDLRNLPRYNPHVSDLRRVDTGSEPGLGAEYRFHLTLPGATESIEVPLRVTEVDAPKRFVYETGPGWMATGVCRFEEQDRGTLITLTYTLTFPGEIDAPTLESMESTAREQARLELENIRAALET